MKKFYSAVIVLLLFMSVIVDGQNSGKADQWGDENRQTIRVEKGKNLSDFMDMAGMRSQVTDMNAGVFPEGDYMLRSVFSPDGTKAFVVNGYTGNITVFDFETMQQALIENLDGYPTDVGVSDNYAVVSCLADKAYVIDLSDYSIAATFDFGGDGQGAAVVISPDGNTAYVAFDVSYKVVKINLTTLEIDNIIPDFPVKLLTFSWGATGGRSTFMHSRFLVSPDNNYLIVGNDDDAVLYFNTETGSVDFTVEGIPDCSLVEMSGDGTVTVAVSNDYPNSTMKVFRINNAFHQVSATVDVEGYMLNSYALAVNADGTKAYISVTDNSAALVNFPSGEFTIFGANYSPFWLGTSPDHQYVIHGQYRFSVFDFDSETYVGTAWGHTQSYGAVSPVNMNVIGYDPIRYEGVYFYDCNDPANIEVKGKRLAGMPPEGDKPYRIAISPDGTKAVSVNGLSESISIINMENYSVDTIIDMGEDCWDVAITHDSHWAVLGGYDLNTIKIVDLQTNEFVKSITTGQRPMMIQISPDDQFAYIGNLKGNSVSFIELDGANSQLITTIPVGVIGISFAALGVKSGVVLDPTGQYLLIAASFNDKVQVVDVAQHQVVADLPVNGSFPLSIAFNATGDHAVVTCASSDNFAVIHVDGANSSVEGTYNCGGDWPLRVAYNAVNDEFGIVLYGSDKVASVDGQTWEITGTTNYSQYETPVQIRYDQQGNPIVLTQGSSNSPGYLIRNMEDFTPLPDVASFFSYCDATDAAAVCMPAYDFITMVEYGVNTDPPVADFSADVTSVQVGDTVAFTDLSLNNPSSWEWSFQGGTPETSNEQNPAVLYETPGVFDVSLTVSNEFGSDTKTVGNYIHVDSIVFAGNGEEPATVRVFPNPFINQLNISINRELQNEIDFALFNAGGKLIFSKKLKDRENVFELDGLNPGIYFIKFRYMNDVHVMKVLKE